VKEYKYVALILAIGILLMLLPEKQEMPDSAPVQSSEGNLQTQLEEILSQIRGVGKVRVLLTVESGERTLYIRDEERSESSENSQTRSQAVIITDSDRAQHGLISQVLPPS
jgi:stage III sporulation protein AG